MSSAEQLIQRLKDRSKRASYRKDSNEESPADMSESAEGTPGEETADNTNQQPETTPVEEEEQDEF